MSGSSPTTPHFSFTLPTVGGDQNTWGNELNGNWTHLDTVLQNIVAPVGGTGYLPLTGGSLSGPLVLSGDPTSAMMPVTLNYLSAQGYAKTSSGPVQFTSSVGIATNTSFNYPTVSDFEVYRNPPQRVFQWASGITDSYNESTGVRYWNGPFSGGVAMSLDSGANLAVSTKGYQPGGGSWASLSDDRVKQDVVPYTSGLDQITQLQPISYRYNGAGGSIDDGKTYYGLSAQSAQAVMPELVHQMPGTVDYLATDLGPLTLALCNAVSQLSDRITALEARHG